MPVHAVVAAAVGSFPFELVVVAVVDSAVIVFDEVVADAVVAGYFVVIGGSLEARNKILRIPIHFYKVLHDSNHIF